MKDLESLYAAIDALSMEGGWHRKRPALWAEPRANFVPHLWRYADVKQVLEAAGPLVDHAMADRRNLTLTNPAEGNWYATARTLVAAYQSIRPGESADAHRHTPNALRIILEGRGSYTVVNGVRVEMRPGDVLLTPSWHWHSHESIGPDECFWVDVLDVPLVHLLEPMFFERHPQKLEPSFTDMAVSPLALRWEDSLRGLDTATAAPAHGTASREFKLDASPLKTMAVHAQRLDAGLITPQYRTTSNAVYTVIEGAGVSRIGDRELQWQRGDLFVIPAWQPFEHRVSERAHFIRVSDEPVMQAFDFLRERSGAA
jgi:gentisate 1,2-dioxygenase